MQVAPAFIAGNMATNLHRELYAAIQQYARTVGGSAIAFTPEAFPYWHTIPTATAKSIRRIGVLPIATLPTRRV